MSLFVSFFMEKIVSLWKKFTLIYLFIYLFIVIITPWYIGDGFMNIQKGTVAIMLSALYFILSLILVLYKSWKLRGKN